MPTSDATTFLATLGRQPQIVSFALDALLGAGVPVSEVIVLYLAPRSGPSFRRLAAEFAGNRYRGRPMRLRPQPLVASTAQLADIRDEADANTVWRVVNQLLLDLKKSRRTLHVCISGGRRIMSLLTMSAAMLHFGHHDTLWHVYTPDDIQEAALGGAIMHLPPDSGFRLIRVPMMPWGSYFPALRQLAHFDADELDVLASPRAFLDDADRARCAQVIDRLTKRQQEVLRAFAGGESPQQVAASLNISIKTVDTHKTAILAECRNAWGLPDRPHLDYRFLAEKFRYFFGT